MNKELNKFVAACFGVVAAFGFGVFIGGKFPQPNSTILVGEGEIKYDQAYINSIIKEIEENYLGDLPSQDEATQGIARGIVESLGNEYSSYLSPAEAGEYLNSTDSAYEGIGVYLGFDGQYTTILTPIDGYPGEKAGLRAGDLILEVDGKDVAGKRPEVTSRLILGKAGTKVALSIFREKDNKVHKYEIERTRIDLENISYEELENGIILIDIVRFTEGSEGNDSGAQVFNRNWDKIVDEVKKKNPKGLIIDLRNNPGGFVHSVRYVAKDFLKEGQIIMKEDEKGKGMMEFKDDRKGGFEEIPVVVLVNEGSASASEILAGAIQDNDRGEIVGAKTYGKGVEQILVDLEDGGLLMLTYRRWLTPSGRYIDKESPINPDVTVEFDKADGAKYDTQVRKALDLLTAK